MTSLPREKWLITLTTSHAHDVYTDFVSKQGFEVTKHFHLETAWKATFTHGDGQGRTIGINSEVKSHIIDEFPERFLIDD